MFDDQSMRARRHSDRARADVLRKRLAFVFLILLATGFPAGKVTPEVVAAALLGNPPAEGSVIRQVSIDDNNVIAYIKDSGIYISGRGRRLIRLAAVGDEAPRTGGTFAEFLDLSSANVAPGILGLGGDLRIVFKARIEGGQVGRGIFLFSENQGIMAVALPGDIAPNTGGGVFSEFPDRVLISDQGTILFGATVVGGQASEGLFFVPHSFITGEAEIDSVAVQGEAASNTGGGVYASFGAYDFTEIALPIGSIPPVILRTELFGFVADVDGGRVPQGLYVSSLVVVSVVPLVLELQTQAIALVGDAAAGLRGESAYASFEDLVVTGNEVVFRAGLDGGSASEGIFQIASIGPALIDSLKVLQGDSAPVFRADVNFAGFGRMVGSNEEELVFEADLEGDGPRQGLFSVTLGPLSLVSETLSTGDPAPGTNGGVYGRLGPLSINNGGRVAFQADIEGGDMSEALYSELAKRARFVDGIR